MRDALYATTSALLTLAVCLGAAWVAGRFIQ